MKSPMYYFPNLYEFSMNRMHSPIRYEVISELVGERNVLELGCGMGILQDKISKKCRYKGIDLNETFVSYGKSKGRNVAVGDIRTYNLNNGDIYDVVVLVDVLHHLSYHGEFLKKLKENGKEIIVCEPFNSLPSFLMPFLVLLDSDGVNNIGDVRWHDKEALTNFMKSNGAKKIIPLKDCIIAVLNSNEKNSKNIG